MKDILLSMARAFVALLWAAPLAAQRSPQEITRMLDRQPCTESSAVKICHYDCVIAGAAVEALSFVAAGDGPFPAALLIPGFQRTARDQISLRSRLAAVGIAAVAVRQPGFRQVRRPGRLRRSETIRS